MTPNSPLFVSKVKPRTQLIYGPSGVGKTTQLYWLAKMMKEKYGKISRLIIAGGGGIEPFEDAGLVDDGWVQVHNIASSKTPLSDVRMLSEGYWPRDDMIGPDGGRYFEANQFCATQDFSHIGAYFIEGMTDVCSLFMDHIRNTGTVQYKQSVAYSQGGYLFGEVQKGHYKFVQQECHFVHCRGFASLPVPLIVWTALEDKGYDDSKGQDIFGPQLAGHAATAEAPSWFGDTFHIASYQVPQQTPNGTVIKDIRVAYLRNHQEQGQIAPYVSRVRMAPEGIPLLERAFPGWYVPLDLDGGLDRYYLELMSIKEQLREKQQQREYL